MRDLNYQLKQLCRRNRDGSFATQRDRERVLDLVANQLRELGYRHMAAASLKPKHVQSLIGRWQAEGLAVGTIKNRMVQMRWWAEGSLSDYGINDDFIRSIADNLAPDTSALFVLVRKAQPDKVLQAMSKFNGRVLRSSLSPEQEDRLQKALSQAPQQARAAPSSPAA